MKSDLLLEITKILIFLTKLKQLTTICKKDDSPSGISTEIDFDFDFMQLVIKQKSW